MNGWVKLHRKITESDIYQMPPLYLRTFLRLVMEANHQDREIPYKEKGQNIVGKKLIQRGERLTSVRDICKWVAWYERGKLKTPNPRTVQNILDWLEVNGMIEIYGTKGNRIETHYKVVNYDTYQDKDSDKVTEKQQINNSKTTVKQQSLHTNKNDKEWKECKEDIVLTQNMKKTIIDEWNKLGLQQLKSINDNTKRHTMLKARLKEYPFEEIIEAIKNINDSDFLKGQNNRNWTITFDWLVRPNNFPKVLEGNYKNKDKAPTTKSNNKNKFNQFDQRNYTSDQYKEIEKKLLNKRMEG